MKTAVSIPDDLFRRAEELAARLGKSRSQVYREALADYVARREPGSITAAVNEVVDEVGPENDPWLAEASRRALERVEWS
jgi:predicted transcriptional regulator